MKKNISIDQKNFTQNVEGIEDIKQCWKNILWTIPGSIPLMPEFGCDIWQYIDKPTTDSFGKARNVIIAALEKWEPRAKVTKVTRTLNGSQVLINILGLYNGEIISSEIDFSEPEPTGLVLTFDSIINAPVADPSSVSDWNTLFDLPTNGSPITAAYVIGNKVVLQCVDTFAIKGLSWGIFESLTKLEDIGYITEIADNSIVTAPNLTDIVLPSALKIGTAFCYWCYVLRNIYIPVCTDLGGTVGYNNGFQDIYGNNITLTVPAELMTCNAGEPDGDIAFLIANNTVTVITV